MAQTLTSATLNNGIYTIETGLKSHLALISPDGPIRETGNLFYSTDTQELFVWDSSLGWVSPTASGVTGSTHDDSLDGNGTSSDPLRTWQILKDFDASIAYKPGSCVFGSFTAGQPGIYRLDSVGSVVWRSHPATYYNHNSPVPRAFNAGEAIGISIPGYEGVYQSNIIFTSVGVPDMVSHIVTGDITLLTSQAWQPSPQTYNIGDLVWVNSNPPLPSVDFSVYYECLQAGLTQAVFSTQAGTLSWTLLANISAGGSGSSLPTGSMLRWLNALPLPAQYLRCDGSAVSKAQYANLYSVIGGLFGETSLTFNLPLETNTIILF